MTPRKILLVAMVGWSSLLSCAQAAEITPEQALDIFRRAYDVDTVLPYITVRAYDLPNNECLKYVEDETTRNKIVRTLEGRKYFQVLYEPPPPDAGGPIFGGPVCLFVDRQTGMIIPIN
jgi:hypothetical protein